MIIYQGAKFILGFKNSNRVEEGFTGAFMELWTSRQY